MTFWNKDRGISLRIMPAATEGRHVAVRFSRHPHGVFSFNYSVTDEELSTKHGQARFLRDKQDVWAPVKVAPGAVSVEYILRGLDYNREYDRGTLKEFDSRSVREICNTVARLGAIDTRIHGSNSWYSGCAVLHEHWIAQLGLAIDDPCYFRSYAETLDYQRDHAICPDGRVKSRWAYGPGDAMPGTYDNLGFYECQWGWLMDSQPSFVTNVAEQFDSTGDVDWARRHKSTCERVLDYLLRRDSDGDELVEMMAQSHAAGRGSDWIDVVWAAHENALVNAEMYNALLLWADVEEVLGDRVKAGRYRANARQLKTSFNKTTAEGGFWDARNHWYVHWRDKDNSIHGNNLVAPVNFMAIAYGICEDPARRDTVLAHVEAQMQKEKLFFWPLCFYSYQEAEAHPSQYPFPTYENGDIFLGWGEVAVRAYAQYDPAVAVRCIKNVLDRYARDGLAFQRYLRKSQVGEGGDILSNMASPVVGLYRNIYGVQPKWNRLYLEPHLTQELRGTELRYWLRDQWYAIDLSPDRYRIAVNDFSLSETKAFGLSVQGNSLEYFCGRRNTPSMSVTRSAAVPLEIRIEAWPHAGAGIRKWAVTCAKGEAVVRCLLFDLDSNTTYNVFRNAAHTETVRSDTEGGIIIECRLSDARSQTFELKQ